MRRNLIHKQYRQGDVLLRPAKIPPGAVALKSKGPIVLAEGEATGHAHKIKRAPSKIEPFVYGTQLYLRIKAPVDLVHEEHGTIKLEPDDYIVTRQVETWLDEVRQVAD